MEQALGRATNICSDGIGMILEYLEFRWSHSNKITDAEANLAARLINAPGRRGRLEPWTVQHGFDATAFLEPAAELMLFLRNSTGICIYVPPTSQMQKHKTLGSPTSYYGRPCRVANLRDSSIYQLTVVLRIHTCDLLDSYRTSDLWLTNSDSYITSVRDILWWRRTNGNSWRQYDGTWPHSLSEGSLHGISTLFECFIAKNS